MTSMTSDFKNQEDEHYEEDDHRTLKVSLSLEENDFKLTGPSSPLMKGMDLDLSFAARKTDAGADREGVQEESLLVIFDLPDGSQGESMVRTAFYSPFHYNLSFTIFFLNSLVDSLN